MRKKKRLMKKKKMKKKMRRIGSTGGGGSEGSEGVALRRRSRSTVPDVRPVKIRRRHPGDSPQR
jgi:hypothetical protein